MARKPAPPPVPVSTQTIASTALETFLITDRAQARGADWAELLDMPYLSKKIMRAYLREFKQGWRVGAVAYVKMNGAIVAMGLCLTVKPVFTPPTHVVAFYVMPAMRRMGLGRQLFKTATGAVPGAPVRPWHYDHDDKSHGFYGALGVGRKDDTFDARQGEP